MMKTPQASRLLRLVPRASAPAAEAAMTPRGEGSRNREPYPFVNGRSAHARLCVFCGVAEVGVGPGNLVSTFMLLILSKHSVYRRTANAKGVGDRAGRFTAGVELR